MYTGVLSAPERIITQEVTSSFIHLSWDPPKSLDLTNVEPDILHYVVNICKSSDDCQDTTLTNDTEYWFYPSGISECAKYRFSVAGVNVVGVGEPSNPVHISLKGSYLI